MTNEFDNIQYSPIRNGFEEKTYQRSEWNRLPPILKLFPENIQNQYKYLSSLLEEHSKSSSWWRDERNVDIPIPAIFNPNFVILKDFFAILQVE